MKSIRVLFIISLFLLTSCKENFDEWADTSQRGVTFILDSGDYFSNILSFDDGEFRMGCSNKIDTAYALRTVCYCYDNGGQLLDTQTRLLPHLGETQITFSHLNNNNTYYFVFMADIIKKGELLNFSEAWCQLGTNRYDNIYLYMVDRKAEPQYNVLLSASLHALPSNQIFSVKLRPMTYNGYCVFTNFGDAESLNASIDCVEAFGFKDIEKIESRLYEYQYNYLSHRDSIIVPISLCNADDEITIRMRTDDSEGNNSVKHIIKNEEHRPFVATFDVSALELDTCIFY